MYSVDTENRDLQCWNLNLYVTPFLFVCVCVFGSVEDWTQGLTQARHILYQCATAQTFFPFWDKVVLSCQGWPRACGPPASVSQVAAITGMCQCAKLLDPRASFYICVGRERTTKGHHNNKHSDKSTKIGGSNLKSFSNYYWQVHKVEVKILDLKSANKQYSNSLLIRPIKLVID